MRCIDARQAMLTAEPEELAGRAATALARHVRACTGCAAAAAAILEHTDALRRALGTFAPSRGPAVALRPTPRRRRRWLVAAPVLAAAGLAGLLLTSNTADRGTDVVPAARAARIARPLVDQPTGHNVAVFNTDNPNIVVVWFF